MNASRFSATRAASLVSLWVCLLALGLHSAIEAEASSGLQRTNQTDLAKAVTHLKEAWDGGKVELVVVAHVHTDRLYAVEFDPSRLDNEAEFRLAVLRPTEQQISRELMAKAAKVTGQPSTGEPAVRWGFTFLDSQGARVFSIYIDRSGRRAIVDGHCVSLDSDELFNWAEVAFKEVFR